MGCANVSAPVVGVLSDSFSEIFADDGHKVQSAALRPDFEYLKVQIKDRPAALLVLGYVDRHPLGDIEVWYSASREVIKLQHGRIVATAGLPLDWRSVSFPAAPPHWPQIAPIKTMPVSYERTRDVMPGYHTGTVERIDVSVAQPPDALTALLPSQKLTWVQERVVSGPNATGSRLPDAWFALGSQSGREQVRFSYQCLSSDTCFTLQRWPVVTTTP